MVRKEVGEGLKIILKKSLLTVLTVGMLVAAPVSAFASGVGGNSGSAPTAEDFNALLESAGGASALGTVTDTTVEEDAYVSLANSIYNAVIDNTYEASGGGTYKGKDIVDEDTATVNDLYTKLTSNSRQELLNDMVNAADEKVNEDKHEEDTSSKVTDGTKNNWLVNLQKCDGVGSQLLTTVLANTKPDFVTANQIYAPFSGLVGTLLGLGAVILFAAVAIVMVLDISYMAIPFIRTIGTDDSGSQKRPSWVSYEAYYAIQQAEGGEGGGNTKGAGKQALGIYLKKRIGMLVLLGICLLYLIQGQIFTFVGWVLDLVQGFVGF